MRYVPLIWAILLFCTVPVVAGERYSGSWCSFEAPDGYTVVSTDDNLVILQKIVSSDLGMQLSATRVKDINCGEYNVELYLKIYLDKLEENLREHNTIGTQSYSNSSTIYAAKGPTATAVRTYYNPTAAMFNYAWCEGKDTVILTLLWVGVTDPSNIEYYIDPIINAYKTFQYYG